MKYHFSDTGPLYATSLLDISYNFSIHRIKCLGKVHTFLPLSRYYNFIVWTRRKERFFLSFKKNRIILLNCSQIFPLKRPRFYHETLRTWM